VSLNRFHLNHRDNSSNPNKKGFTLAEMLIASVILAFLISTGVAISSNFFNSLRNIQAANTVYDEANFTMERIIKEVRNGTVDYEEYYNQAANFFGIATNQTYGQNYCQYSRQFYAAGPDGQFGTFDDESTGQRRNDPAPIAKPMQTKLYLINTEGNRRTYFQRVVVQKTDALGKPIGEPIGKVAMLKLVGKDYGIDHMAWTNNALCRDSGEGDGLVDTWVCDSGFACAKESKSFTVNNGATTCAGILETPLDTPGHLNDVVSGDVNTNMGKSSFVDITPDTIDVVSLDFIITPQDDPRKAYSQADVQLQPSVTVKMVARAAPQIAATFKGQTPNISLESTISSRTAKEVITECNLQECIDGDKKPCPKHTGMLVNAQQTCSQGIWPGCVEKCTNNPDPESCYEEVAALFIKASLPAGAGADGLDHDAAFGGASGTGKSFYESTGGEIGSCGTDDVCKIRRCHDGVDNDVNDKTDESDPACLSYVCNNGYLDPGEDCIDVGGICSFIHPHLAKENFDTCSDNYDNDCSYKFDLKWDGLDGTQKAKVQSIGLGQSATTAQLNIALGLGADEYDKNCINDVFCSNGIKDPPAGMKKFGPKFYETPNYLVGKPESDDLSESCIDIGGLCDQTTDGKHKKVGKEYDTNSADPLVKSGDLCKDGLDNDCNGTADEFDTNCKQAICSNGFKDCNLAPTNYTPKDYLLGFRSLCSDALDQGCCNFTYPSSLDEQCPDIGGLCGTTVAEDTIALCFDSMDNDCNGKKDGVIDLLTKADPNCCPDQDIDGYSAYSTTCHPKNATEGGSPGFIDCNDHDPKIFPTSDPTAEVCDDATYASDYAVSDLRGMPIDNNCSAVNKLFGENFGDSGWDHEDPACCVDTDMDNFGIKEANLFKDVHHVPQRCSAAPDQPDVERTPYDCNDLDKNINPNTHENTIALCNDHLNNSCRFIDGDPSKQPRMDHIDMYVDATDQQTTKDSLKAAFDAKKFNPDCCQLTQSKKSKFKGMEICDDKNSLLNPGVLNSDENCNGLEGYNDHYCTIKTGTDAQGGDLYNGFHDNFTFNTYLDTGATDFSALYDPDQGTISLNPAKATPQVALSSTIPVDETTCPAIRTVTINHDPVLPAGTDITYEVTSDGGDHWFPAVATADGFQATIPVDIININLRWRATLSGVIPDSVPTLNGITLTWSCG
jgi:prepilin-type N-terminal cleavage/methylation domain-containing protein